MAIKNKVSISREILADMETPLSVYQKLANAPFSYLFESVEGGDKWARYSLIGLPANRIIRISGNHLEVTYKGRIIESKEINDPLEFIETYQKKFHITEVEGLPKFNGGLVGYFGYDCVRYIEPKLRGSQPLDTLGTPDILFMVSEEVAVFDNLKNKLYLVVLVDSNSEEQKKLAEARLDDLEKQLQTPLPDQALMQPKKSIDESDFISSFGENEFKAAVRKVKEDIYSFYGRSNSSLQSYKTP